MAAFDSVERQPYSPHHTVLADEETTHHIKQPHYKAWLVQKWTCSLPGHSMCVPTADKEHYQLSDQKVEIWANALCFGGLTLLPPEFALDSKSSFSTYIKCIERGNFSPEAILGALLRERQEISPPIDPSSPSETEETSPITDTNLELSAGFRRRYRSEKAIKWLPVRLLNILDSDSVIRTRAEQHLLQLEVWQLTRHHEVGTDMQVELFEMLEDALEMSRTCYSRRANKYAALIGLEIQRWILSCPGASLTKETAPWLCRLHVGLFPLYFGGNTDLRRCLCECGDLSLAGRRFEELLDLVTDTPSSQPLKATPTAIKIMSKSLGSMPYIFPYTPLLGNNLVQVIDTVSQMRGLNEDEINALRRMAAIRLETAEGIATSSRPWEIVIFAQCAPWEPLMREVVLGNSGFRSLLRTLKTLSRPWSRRSKDRKHLVDLLGALQHLLQYSWLADTLDPGILDLWKNLCSGRMLEHVLLSSLKTSSTSHIVAYSPVTGRRTMAHKTGSPAFAGPLSFVSDVTPLEEYYKQEAEDRIKGLYIAMKGWADITEPIPPSPPLSTTLSSMSDVLALILPSPTADASSVTESYASTTGLTASSLLPGIGYLSAKALRWIGEGSLDTVAQAIIWRRTKHHMSRLKRWQRLRCNELDHTRQRKLFDMLYDALEMSHPGYSSRVNNYATSIGVELQEWLISCVDDSVIDENTCLMARIHICICSTYLATVSEFESRTSFLELLRDIRRVPLELDNSTATSTAIRIISKEISRSSCSASRNRLAVSLMQIVKAAVQSRQLTGDKLDAIRNILASHLRLSTNRSSGNCHPWEVAILAECASQEPAFKEFVLGNHGISSIIFVLQRKLSNVTISAVDWDHLCCIVSALNRLSRYAWIAKTVEPGVIGLLLNVFSRTEQQPQFRLRCLAIQTIQNIVSQPGRCRSCFTGIAMPLSSPRCESYASALNGNPETSSTSLNPLYSTGHEEPISQTQPNPYETQTTPEVHQGSYESVAKDGAAACIITINDYDNSRGNLGDRISNFPH